MSLDPSRAKAFCKRFGLKLPILLAPMAGACPPSLSIAMMNAGSLGAGGALLMQPNEIVAWADEVRAKGDGPFQLNLWIPDPQWGKLVAASVVQKSGKVLSELLPNVGDGRGQAAAV